MGDQQLTTSRFGSIEPATPGFPSPVGKRFQKLSGLVPSSRHDHAMASQQSTVFAQALLDVSRGGLVHAHMQHHSSLDGWLRGHERLNGG